MNELLGGRIRTLREAKDITQEKMAEQLNVSRQKYARIEKGQCSITYEILAKISEILKISVKDITDVLESRKEVVFRSAGPENETNQMFEMLDLFYANKHLYKRLRDRKA